MAAMPDVPPLAQPYWDGVAAGRLSFLACRACGHRWLPASEACPRCLAAQPAWETASGHATLLSWVVYRKAYDAGWEADLPYAVLCVALAEGPQLLACLAESADPADLRLAMPLRFSIRTRAGAHLPAFAPAGTDRTDSGTTGEAAS